MIKPSFTTRAGPAQHTQCEPAPALVVDAHQEAAGVILHGDNAS
jgi:hypothetical protein